MSDTVRPSRDGKASILTPRSTSTDPKKETGTLEKREVAAVTLGDDAPVVYPSTQKRIFIMVALSLSMFLVTLVSTRSPGTKPHFAELAANWLAGSKHHIYGHSTHHG